MSNLIDPNYCQNCGEYISIHTECGDVSLTDGGLTECGVDTLCCIKCVPLCKNCKTTLCNQHCELTALDGLCGYCREGQGEREQAGRSRQCAAEGD